MQVVLPGGFFFFLRVVATALCCRLFFLWVFFDVQSLLPTEEQNELLRIGVRQLCRQKKCRRKVSGLINSLNGWQLFPQKHKTKVLGWCSTLLLAKVQHGCFALIRWCLTDNLAHKIGEWNVWLGHCLLYVRMKISISCAERLGRFWATERQI